jgi:hypothetical protein
MSNIVSDAPAAHSLGSCPGRPSVAYHPPIQTSHLYGGHLFTSRAIPESPPLPESHSP